MNEEQILPALLPVAGVVLQFVIRQFDKVPEPVYHAIALTLALICYGLVTDEPFKDGTRQGLIALILWLTMHLPAIWGGTFAMSNGAKMLAKGRGSGSLAVPVTNSK